MFDRTVTIGSAGKTWSVTGWKQGWVIGPEVLIRAAQRFWNNSGSSGHTPIQEAIDRAFCFEMKRDENVHATQNPASYFQTLTNDELAPKKFKMAKIIENMGLTPIIPDAGYFMMVDATKLKGLVLDGEDASRPWDVQCKLFSRITEKILTLVCRWMTRKHKVTAIPVSAFYHMGSSTDCYIRFCFAKQDETLGKVADYFLNNKI